MAWGWGLSACAVGGAGPTGKDAGIHDSAVFPDSGTNPGNDASTPDATDSGPIVPPPDSGSPPPDSGSPPPDAGPPPSDGGNTGCAYTGALATYDFTSQPGNETSVPVTTTAANVTAGDVTRASTLTPVSGASSINSSGWATTATIDTTRYYTFSVTPTSGCALDLGSLSISTQASGTGPTQAAAATSDDNFGATTAVSPSGTSTPTLSVTGATGTVEIRVYGYGASSTGGTLRINGTLTVSGVLH